MSIIKRNTYFPTLPSVFDNFFGADVLRGADFNLPSVNIAETEDGFRVEVAAPGMQKDDFQIEVDNNLMTISAEKKNESETKKENYTHREFSHTSFKRSFTLPTSVNGEAIEAKYENGILNIHIPKREEAKRKPARTVSIN